VPSPAAVACPLTVVAWRLGTLSLTELSWRYTELGGNRCTRGLGDYLAGTVTWPASEHNVLAQALNEGLWDRGHPSLAPYRGLDADRSSLALGAQDGSHEPF
jgi:hypothetical protein